MKGTNQLEAVLIVIVVIIIIAIVFGLYFPQFCASTGAQTWPCG